MPDDAPLFDRALLTNDDGCEALGLQVLQDVAAIRLPAPLGTETDTTCSRSQTSAVVLANGADSCSD